jgi:glycosyltransferase involved in cell wall biosynthesis
MRPLVSVVIPTRNRAALLEEAIASVLAQEGAGEFFDMEVVVVDDASSDNTAEIVRRYPGVRYIRLATQHGEGGARNEGIRASRGKYVAFLDDDDLMLPQRLRLQVPAMEEHPEVGVVYSQNIIRGKGIEKWWPDATPSPSGETFDKTWPDPRQAPSGDVFAAMLKREFLSADTLLVRREAFDRVGYFESFPTEAHYDMFLRLAFHVPFLFVPGNVAVNRVNFEGVFHARLAGEEGRARMLPTVVERALGLLPDSAYSRRLRCEVHASLVPRLFSMIERLPDIDSVRNYTRIALRCCPWLVAEPEAKSALVANTGCFTRGPGSPIAVTRAVCVEIGAAATRATFKERLRRRRLLAALWMAVAIDLAFRGQPARLAAICAAARSFLYNPLPLEPTVGKLGARLLLGSRLYSLLSAVGRQLFSRTLTAGEPVS